MERYLKIAAQYNVTRSEIGDASAEASRYTDDLESEDWYTVFACALGNIEDQKGAK
jgi:hypothetical protein